VIHFSLNEAKRKTENLFSCRTKECIWGYLFISVILKLVKPKKRQKLCHNCEGEIDIDVIVCPYCAADLREEKPEQSYAPYVSTTAPMDRQETMQSLYPSAAQTQEIDPREVEMPKQIAEEGSIEKNRGFVPTVFFTIGVQLFIFSLLMLLFSHKGVVILKWDARFWFFYLFASIPFLVLGYKKLSKL
jgi:hypothetical protein